jgi:hypothetical protein
MKRELPNLSIKKSEPRGSSQLALSIAIHVLVILALAGITFRYPLGRLIGLTREEPNKPERLQYIALPRGEPVGNGSRTTPAPAKKKEAPAPLQAPTVVPNTVPQTPAPDATEGAVSGKTGGAGSADYGAATGVEPRMPDPRLPLGPGPFRPLARTSAEQVDSVVRAAFGVYFDSVAIANANKGREPGDWTVTKDGKKWGWDPVGIRLGKFTIPNAVLAALPLDKVANGRSPVDQRNAAWIQRDIFEHAQRAVSEDEFRDAVRRIRERKERERREKEKALAADGKDAGSVAKQPR